MRTIEISAIGAVFVALAFGVVACSVSRPSAPPAAAELTHGVAVGEVTPTSAVFWGRCNVATDFRVRTAQGATGAVAVGATSDFTGTVTVEDLPANADIEYSAWCGHEKEPPADDERVLHGRFSTPPTPRDGAVVRIVWGGDVGGQNACRDANEDYVIFERVRQRQPSVFVALGDMIYADDGCNAVGRYGNAQLPGPPPSSAEVESFRQHWRYNRSDPHQIALLKETSMIAVWDDHEIVNDAGPRHDEAAYAPGVPRLAPAHTAFLEYQPMRADEKFYRRFGWGENVEIFVLDQRSYRDANFAPDTAAEPKTMLGDEQHAWLVDGVARSKATWKVIVSTVPISIPTGSPTTRVYDGWANYDGDMGFERELRAILTAWRKAGVHNLVFITTDVHFATGFRYRPFPDFSFYEFVSGPLNAGMFPKQEFDDTLHPERLFFYAPPDLNNVHGIDEARHFYNFGELEVGADGALQVRIVNGDGDVVFEDRYAAIEPAPAPAGGSTP